MKTFRILNCTGRKINQMMVPSLIGNRPEISPQILEITQTYFQKLSQSFNNKQEHTI